MRNLFTKMGGVESTARKMGKNILSLLLLTSLALASCKDDSTELRSALGEQLTLSVGVNSSTASRAMVIGTQLPEGSSIGVRVTDGGADYQGTDYSHVRFTSAGTGDAQKWTAEPPVYLSGQAATIYAYSPYQSTEGFEMTAIPVDMTEADQTDWLYATPVTGPCDSNPKADITLNHALTAFTLSFHKEGYPGAGEVTAVKIQSPALATGGTLDATAGEFTEVTGQGDALTRTAVFTLGDAVAQESTVQVMAVPTALKAALNITVTVDGKDYTAATSSMNFIAGHNYALTMKLTAKDLGLSEVEIIDWQNVDLGEDELQPEGLGEPLIVWYDNTEYEGERFLANGIVKNVEAMFIDGKEVEPNNNYTYNVFDFEGLHEVHYYLKDKEKMPDYMFNLGVHYYFDTYDYEYGPKPVGIKFPSTTKEIGSCFLRGVFSLKDKIIIPKSVEKIGQDAFWLCSTPEIEVEEGNPYYNSGNGCNAIIETATGTLVRGNELTVIPEGVTKLGDHAFSCCKGLKKITLPSTLTTIGDEVFDKCINLNFIKCLSTVSPQAVSYSFMNRHGYDYYGIAQKGTLIVPQGCVDNYKADGGMLKTPIDEWEIVTDDDIVLIDGIYYSADGTTILSCETAVSGEIIIPEGVTEISESAFFGCTGVTAVTLPSTLQTIGDRAFYGCSNLVNITSLATIPPTVDERGEAFINVKERGILIVHDDCFDEYSAWINSTNILGKSYWTIRPIDAVLENSIWYSADGKTVFGNDGTLDGAVIIKEGVTTIADKAFFECKGITSVTLPSTLETIGVGAFDNCSGITEITWPLTLTTIGDNAFSNCTGMTGELVIPKEVKNIGRYAFSGCERLTEVTLPSTLQTIGDGAFSGCAGLVSITIPEGMTSIGGYAFNGCSNLGRIISLATTAPIVDYSTFYEMKFGGVLIVPQGCTDAYSEWMSTDYGYLGYNGWTIQEQ